MEGMGDNPTDIMRAVRTGIIKRPGGGRYIVKRGDTTAHAGHEIVTGHRHLWQRLTVDFPVDAEQAGTGEDRYGVALDAAGIRWAEAVRRLAQGLADRGYDVPTTGADDVNLPERVVDLALQVADYQTGRSEAVPMRREPAAEDGFVEGEPVDGAPEVVEETITEVVEVEETATSAGPADPGTKEGRAEIRRWARGEDIEVADSGPLPGDVVTQYLASFNEPAQADAEDDD